MKRMLGDPAVWMIAGLGLNSLSRLLDPYTGGGIELLLHISGSILLLVGTTRLVARPRPILNARMEAYVSGIYIGLVGGFGVALVSAPVVKAVPPYFGSGGLAMVLVATILGFRRRLLFENDADAQRKVTAAEQKS